LQFVVVFNLTRFARENYDHFALRAHLKSLGISLRSATEPINDTSTGKLMEGVLAAFAQFDNDVRSDRTRAGMKVAMKLAAACSWRRMGHLNGRGRWARASSTIQNGRRRCGVGSRNTRPVDSPRNNCSSRREGGLDQPSQPTTEVTGDGRAAAQSALRRHRGRARVRRSRTAR
jgi:hypothetical protein